MDIIHQASSIAFSQGLVTGFIIGNLSGFVISGCIYIGYKIFCSNKETDKEPDLFESESDSISVSSVSSDTNSSINSDPDYVLTPSHPMLLRKKRKLN
jgi:hypothetical protein